MSTTIEDPGSRQTPFTPPNIPQNKLFQQCFFDLKDVEPIELKDAVGKFLKVAKVECYFPAVDKTWLPFLTVNDKSTGYGGLLEHVSSIGSQLVVEALTDSGVKLLRDYQNMTNAFSYGTVEVRARPGEPTIIITDMAAQMLEVTRVHARAAPADSVSRISFFGFMGAAVPIGSHFVIRYKK